MNFSSGMTMLSPRATERLKKMTKPGLRNCKVFIDAPHHFKESFLFISRQFFFFKFRNDVKFSQMLL